MTGRHRPSQKQTNLNLKIAKARNREMMRDVHHLCPKFESLNDDSTASIHLYRVSQSQTILINTGDRKPVPHGQISHLEGSRTGLPAEFLSSQSYHWRPRITGCHGKIFHENTWILSVLLFFNVGSR